MIKKIILISVVILLITTLTIPLVNDFTEESDSVDIILIDGQSNGAYYSNNSSRCNPSVVNEELGKPSHKALYYGTETTSSNTVGEDTTIREMYRGGQWKIGGEEAGLAYYLMEKNHRDVLVLNIAHGATGIKDLATGDYWVSGKAVIEAALTEINSLYESKNIIGFVMIHGEADRNQTVSYYEEWFMILDRNLDKLGFEKCYFALPRYVNGLNAYDAMIDLADKYRNIYIGTAIADTFTVSNGLLNSGNLHYTQLGRLVLSEAIVNAIPADPEDDYSELFTVIPVILLVGVILMAVGLMRNRSN